MAPALIRGFYMEVLKMGAFLFYMLALLLGLPAVEIVGTAFIMLLRWLRLIR